MCDFIKKMKKYRGKIAKIELICGRFILLDIDNQEFSWTEDMFDRIEEDFNMKELTFKEVIANIKEGEVWESREKIIKCSNTTITIEDRDGFGLNYMNFQNNTLYKLQRKQYSFEEAFKSYEEGKTIKACNSGTAYKQQHGASDCYEDGRKTNYMYISDIRGKWYIND